MKDPTICCIHFVRSFDNCGESSTGTGSCDMENVALICAAHVVVSMYWGGQNLLVL